MEDCIFCKIAEGKIPSTNVYEDKDFLSFLDINPCNKGHCLIITKKHYETFNDIPSDELASMMKVVQNVSKSVVSSTSCHGYNIIMNSRKAAGQVVPHVHFHVIPRLDNDKVISTWRTTKYSEGEMQEYAKTIKKKIA